MFTYLTPGYSVSISRRRVERRESKDNLNHRRDRSPVTSFLPLGPGLWSLGFPGRNVSRTLELCVGRRGTTGENG